MFVRSYVSCSGVDANHTLYRLFDVAVNVPKQNYVPIDLTCHTCAVPCLHASRRPYIHIEGLKCNFVRVRDDVCHLLRWRTLVRSVCAHGMLWMSGRVFWPSRAIVGVLQGDTEGALWKTDYVVIQVERLHTEQARLLSTTKTCRTSFCHLSFPLRPAPG